MVAYISTWMVYGFAILSLIIIVSLTYAVIKGAKNLRSSFSYLLWSSILIDLGIVVHTFAFLQYSGMMQTYEFVAGHIMLLAGFVVLAASSKKIERLSKEIGFGGK